MAVTPVFSKKMSIVVDGSTIGMASDYDLAVDKDMVEVVYLNSSGWKTSTPDMKGWRVTFNGFVTVNSADAATNTSYDALMFKLLNYDTSVYVKLLPDVSVQNYYAGNGYIKSLSHKAGAGQAMTFSGEIQGIDALSILKTG